MVTASLIADRTPTSFKEAFSVPNIEDQEYELNEKIKLMKRKPRQGLG